MKNYESVSADDIRAIHSRLDVHKQAMDGIINMLIEGNVCYYRDVEEILEMLEESQNPFNQNETGG